MKRSIIQSAMLAVALLLSASLSLAVENKTGTAGEARTISNAKKTEKSAKPAKAAAKVKLVDINSAGKSELKTLPGISDADADKIIAGRPYFSKAHLTTRNIISRPVYEGLKKLVIAGQTQDVKASLPKSK